MLPRSLKDALYGTWPILSQESLLVSLFFLLFALSFSELISLFSGYKNTLQESGGVFFFRILYLFFACNLLHRKGLSFYCVLRNTRHTSSKCFCTCVFCHLLKISGIAIIQERLRMLEDPVVYPVSHLLIFFRKLCIACQTPHIFSQFKVKVQLNLKHNKI